MKIARTFTISKKDLKFFILENVKEQMYNSGAISPNIANTFWIEIKDFSLTLKEQLKVNVISETF